MFDYDNTYSDLKKLHIATSSLAGYISEQAEEFIEVGEYGLALDTIASAYLLNSAPMPKELFTIFEHLSHVLGLENDPEFTGVTTLLNIQSEFP